MWCRPLKGRLYSKNGPLHLQTVISLPRQFILLLPKRWFSKHILLFSSNFTKSKCIISGWGEGIISFEFFFSKKRKISKKFTFITKPSQDICTHKVLVEYMYWHATWLYEVVSFILFCYGRPSVVHTKIKKFGGAQSAELTPGHLLYILGTTLANCPVRGRFYRHL